MGIVLRSNRLRVHISEPGEGRNQTTRFNRAGFIDQVTLDDQYDCCAIDPTAAFSHISGVGLCCEYQFLGAYEEAAVGDWFPKFGVGLLQKEDDVPYHFAKQYQCRPFEVRITASGPWAEFVTLSRLCMGYALEHHQRVEVVDNCVTMATEVRNVGERGIAFEEYCHNFITLENRHVGSGYRIKMPVSGIEGKEACFGGLIIGAEDGLRFSDTGSGPSLMEIAREEIGGVVPFQWTLSHRDSALEITETTSFIPARIAVWTMNQIISPEIFGGFTVESGERVEWRREWTFCAHTGRRTNSLV